MAQVEVLIPTCNRPAALAVTLTSLLGQDFHSFDVIVSDQSDAQASFEAGECQAIVRVLRLRGHRVHLLRNLPRRGLAQQRQFLLERASAPQLLFLDDDVILEPDLLGRLSRLLIETRCGFVASAVIGPSYEHDLRPHQQAVEFWDGPVRPEHIEPDDPRWQRHLLHNAANLLHVQRAVGATPQSPRLYKIAWAGGCVLYDADKLREAGGFGFWQELPPQHCGEDVLAQLRVMARFGGCGVMPSGAYHQELPTTVPLRDCDAPKVLAVHGEVAHG